MPDNTPVSALLHEPLSAGGPIAAAPLEGNMHRREVRIYGTAHDVNRLMQACRDALKQAEASANFNDIYLVQVDPPHEDEA